MATTPLRPIDSLNGATTIASEIARDPAKKSLDALFHTTIAVRFPNGPQNPFQKTLVPNLEEMDREIAVVDRMFDADALENRVRGARECLAIRRHLAMDLFQNGVRPSITALLKKHGEERPFEEVVSIIGFNRLFVRDVASAGTDVDFILLVDTKNPQLLADIRNLMRNEVKPELIRIGIDMEAADYLMIDLPKYTSKLDDTRNALFTLANMLPQNTRLATGSKEIHTKAFSFTDEQLVNHFANLLFNHNQIKEADLPDFKKNLLVKLQERGEPFRKELLSHLQIMASSELYIGEKPYNKKQTIQTIISKVPAQDRQNRTALFSIKFCINRIADLIYSTNLTPAQTAFSKEKVKQLETLGLILSNIICRQGVSNGHPALTLQEAYSDITLEQIANMNISDRKMVAELLTSLGVPLNADSEQFAEECYDALWTLGDNMYAWAGQMEKQIYQDAMNLAI